MFSVSDFCVPSCRPLMDLVSIVLFSHFFVSLYVALCGFVLIEAFEFVFELAKIGVTND